MPNQQPIQIIIRNNLRLGLLSPSFRDTLMEKLTIANPKYIENARLGRYNFKTPKALKFYDKVGKDGLWIPRGYIRHLVNLCKENKISYEILDQRRSLSPVTFNFSGRLKPFQQNAVKTMLAKEFGALSAPTGSGKTIMALYMIAVRKQPALIVVHTKELAFQWIERIETFLGVPSDQCGLIGAGRKTMGEKITVALVQSLYRCADAVAPKIGHIVVDECHRTPSRTFTDAVTEFDSRFMLGLSATPWRRDRLSKLIFWHLGDVHHKIDKADLVESGDVLAADIIVRETEFKPYYDPVREYSKMLSELTTDDKRNRLIASDVAALVLVFFEVVLGLFLMESLQITRLFPIIGSLDDKLRKQMMLVAFVLLVMFAGIESSLAYMRDLLAADREALTQSLAGIIVEAPEFRWITTVGQMTMGFILPFALMLIAIPLESFVHALRTVIGMGAVLLLRTLAFIVRQLGSLASSIGHIILNVYDLIIFIPLKIEHGFKGKSKETKEHKKEHKPSASN